MKKNNLKPIRHGELVLNPVHKLPSDAILVKISQKEIIAESESHHHHWIEVKDKTDLSKFKFYTSKDGEYVEVPAMSELWHQKSGEYVHKTLPVAPGIYKRQRKVEYDYFLRILRAVRD